MEKTKNSITLYDSKAIQQKIYTIRNVQVMLDSDLAKFYGVETKQLNRAVKRNIDRFPEEFMFQLDDNEWESLRYQIGTSNKDSLRYQNGTSIKKGGRRYLPYVFTEQGVAMLSGVLKSDTAVKMSVQIISAFVAMRKFIINNAQIFQRIDIVERKQLKHEMETDEKFEKVFNALQSKELEPKQGIFFDGQIFDAYKFVSDLIRKAEKSILLIDNFIDDTVLSLFTKRKKNVSVTIYTANLSKTLMTDLKKFNAQYHPVEVKEFKNSHDRFMIIDEEDVYHFGASLKDLGKKWFAFSKFEKKALQILDKLNEKKI
ncbi:MAG: ORF6N domain-containing protein [Ignavibacteriaceae bacterium]|nr:ORF6N domain-containing protein [Ignavibacteriaceae bacterium]